jgi:hypothetical protein
VSDDGIQTGALHKLAERILAKGADVPLAMLLEFAVSVKKLRALARKLGLSPKGGYRIERAPAHVLAPLLAEQREAESLEQVLALLLPAPDAKAERPQSPQAPSAEMTALLSLREAEVARLRAEVERMRESMSRSRERESDLQRRLELSERDVLVLRQQIGRLERVPDRAVPDPRGQRALQQQLHDLEGEREGLIAADEALRRQLAHTRTRVRELERVVTEFEAILPKGRRRKRPPPEPPEPERTFRLPWFTASFYKSLEGKERRSIERAVHAILLFCTEGHAYPGLEVKLLGGQDTWSLRASLGLRVYFRSRDDGDIEVLELADREEQHTTLRRLKER